MRKTAQATRPSGDKIASALEGFNLADDADAERFVQEVMAFGARRALIAERAEARRGPKGLAPAKKTFA